MKSTSFSVAGNVWSAGSNGKTFPRGTATLTYDAAQATRALSVQIGDVSLPDGSAMGVTFYDVIVVGTYYGTPVYTYVPHNVGTMTVYGGKASLSISTANSDDVPLFGPRGQVDVYALDDAGNLTGLAAYGNYVLTGGGGGNP